MPHDEVRDAGKVLPHPGVDLGHVHYEHVVTVVLGDEPLLLRRATVAQVVVAVDREAPAVQEAGEVGVPEYVLRHAVDDLQSRDRLARGHPSVAVQLLVPAGGGHLEVLGNHVIRPPMVVGADIVTPS